MPKVKVDGIGAADHRAGRGPVAGHGGGGVTPSVGSVTIACFATVLAAGVPSAALAQLKPELQTGSMIPVKPRVVDSRAAGIVQKHFAQCIYRQSRSKAAALLDHSDPASVDLTGAGIVRVNSELSMSDCLSNQVGAYENALSMKLSPTFLRDLLAEEAYLAANRVAPQLPADAAPIQAAYVSTGEELAKAQGIVSFADCAVRKDVTHSDALLRTMPGSDSEQAAARALAPTLGGCLVQGQQFTLSPTSIRAFIAFAMWSRFGRGSTQ